MVPFAAIDIGRTGMGFNQYWLEVVSHNVANVNTFTNPAEAPFRQRFVVARANGDQFAPTGSGVHVADLVADEAEAPLHHDPDHPLADADGYVQGSVTDLTTQLTDLMVAQRAYQANSRVVASAREQYASALKIGQR